MGNSNCGFGGCNMSFHKRINEAIRHLEENDPEAALTPLLNSVNAVSGRGGRSDYKKWLSVKMPIISCCLLDGGPSAEALHLPIESTNQEMAKPDSHGSIPLQEILYHLVRCELDHNCEVSDSIQDTRDCSIHWDSDKKVLHLNFRKLAIGLLLSVLSEIPRNQSNQITGTVSGYELSHFCELETREVVNMIRAISKPIGAVSNALASFS